MRLSEFMAADPHAAAVIQRLRRGSSLRHLMAGLIPGAQIRIYPDSAHASLFQAPEQVAADLNAFLD